MSSNEKNVTALAAAKKEAQSQLEKEQKKRQQKEDAAIKPVMDRIVKQFA